MSSTRIGRVTHALTHLENSKREEKRREGKRQRAMEKKNTVKEGYLEKDSEKARNVNGREKKRDVYAGLPGSYQWSSSSTGDTRG